MTTKSTREGFSTQTTDTQQQTPAALSAGYPVARTDAQAAQLGRRVRRQRPPKLYRIGEIVDYAGVSRQTIHNYTTMGLLREIRWTAGGHRLFDESVFGRLDRIAKLKAANKSLQQIRDHFARADEQYAG